MAAHTKGEFEKFIGQLKDTNATLSYYTDFDKIANNVDEVSYQLNILNYLIGKTDLRKAVEFVWKRDKEAFQVMDILIATRKKDKRLYIDAIGECKPVHSLFSSVDGIMEFLENTGLAEVLTERKVENLVDYVFGVEVGLDSNARKNRSGDTMEDWVESALTSRNIRYSKEVSSDNYPKLRAVLGADQKVFDFAFTRCGTTYLVETNFYSTGGSKPNEVARSYTDIAPKINSVSGYQFVWVTDGKGWLTAKNKLQEAFAAIPNIFNMTTFDAFLCSL